MSTDANRLGERIGARTSIVVRSRKNALLRSGIELVPSGTLDEPSRATVYWRGTEVARLDVAPFRSRSALLATLFREVADFLEDAADEEE